MSPYRRRYSRELKLEVIRRVHETGRSQAQVAKELGISTNTLSRWMRQHREEKAEAFPGTGRQTSQAALISRLRREKGPRGPWSVSRRHGRRIDNPASSSV